MKKVLIVAGAPPIPRTYRKGDEKFYSKFVMPALTDSIQKGNKAAVILESSWAEYLLHPKVEPYLRIRERYLKLIKTGVNDGNGSEKIEGEIAALEREFSDDYLFGQKQEMGKINRGEPVTYTFWGFENIIARINATNPESVKCFFEPPVGHALYALMKAEVLSNGLIGRNYGDEYPKTLMEINRLQASFIKLRNSALARVAKIAAETNSANLVIIATDARLRGLELEFENAHYEVTVREKGVDERVIRITLRGLGIGSRLPEAVEST